MILISHPTGNANVRQAALALSEGGLLAEYWTCLSWDPSFKLAGFISRRIRGQLERRALPAALRTHVRHLPWIEAGRMVAGQLGLHSLIRHEVGPFCIDAVYRSLDRRVARRVGALKGLTAVYAYEDGAADTFAAARRGGIKTIYDLPIGYWRVARAIYAEEAEREPEWACTLSGINDSAAKLERKDHELGAADLVITASTFTRQTLNAASDCRAPIHIIPYGSPTQLAVSDVSPRRPGPLRVLFVGSLGQRKGLSYLLEAARMLSGRIALTLIGRKVSEQCVPLNAALEMHRWIPTLSHGAVLREMAASDVLVFPSLFEGFGLVILEAMAQGIPVIATPHTAGPDLIEDGRDGFIIPIRSAEAIAEKLDLLIADGSLLSEMKSAARETALRRVWADYRTRLLQTVRDALQNHTLP